MSDRNEATMNHCRWCGLIHGPLCPSIAAMEFHPDGTLKRVVFVQPNPLYVDFSKITTGPIGLAPDGKGGYLIGVGSAL